MGRREEALEDPEGWGGAEVNWEETEATEEKEEVKAGLAEDLAAEEGMTERHLKQV